MCRFVVTPLLRVWYHSRAFNQSLGQAETPLRRGNGFTNTKLVLDLEEKEVRQEGIEPPPQPWKG